MSYLEHIGSLSLNDFFKKENDARSEFLNQEDFQNFMKLCAEIAEKMNDGFKIAFCGNGGSATFASHMAGEFVGRYKKNKDVGLPAIALNDIANLTAIGNDYGYDFTFSIQVDAHLKSGDVLVLFSTSGNSQNVVNAAATAYEKNLLTVAFTGQDGGALRDMVDYCIRVPSNETAIIQSVHMSLGHFICEVIDDLLF